MSQTPKNRPAVTKQIEKDNLLKAEWQLYHHSFFEFFKQAVKVLEPFTAWEFTPFHEYLCGILQQEAIRIQQKKKKDKDYIVSIPPRTSKSLIVSVCYNAWVWALVNPYASFVTVSHTESLAVDLAFKTRQIIESDWYKSLFPYIILRSDTSAKGDFQNTHGGRRTAFSATGGVTGFGGDFLIIDDYLKPQDQNSIIYETAIKTYRETIYNRLNNPSIGIRFIVGQRIDENDLTGFLLKNSSQNYHHICLPLELTEDVKPEYLQFYKDGILWDRFKDVIHQLQSELGLQGYTSQYLQQPSPAEGTVIKADWFDVVDSFPADAQINLFIDTAEGENKKKNDASTVLVTAFAGNHIYIIDVVEVWEKFTDLLRTINEVGEKYPNCKLYIEPKSSGKAIITSLREHTKLNIIELPGVGRDGKEKRVAAISPKLEARRVKLFKPSTGAGWIETFMYQMKGFPRVKQTGMVDTLAYSVAQLLGGTTGNLNFYW